TKIFRPVFQTQVHADAENANKPPEPKFRGLAYITVLQDCKAFAKDRFLFSVGSVQLCQLGQVCIAILRCVSGCLKQLCGTLRERTLQAAVTSLALDELFVVRSGSLGVQRERVLTLCLLARIEAEVVPVAGLNRTLHLVLAVGHTALNTVHLAGCITDDEGR